MLLLAGALAITLAFAAILFSVPARDIPKLALVLAGAGGAIGLPAMLLTRPAVLRRFGGVRVQLLGVSLISNLLLLGMVVAGAAVMFISLHDLSILSSMLLFAVLLAIGLGVRGADPLAQRIERVRAGTKQLARGELGTELPVEGRDELAGLADDFNRMARKLEETTKRERGLEQARRDLIAAVSHDLRTPLAAVLALIEAVADGVVDAETEGRYLSSARSELMALSRLVDDLFELVQIDAGLLRLHLEPTSLRDLISDTLSSMANDSEYLTHTRVSGKTCRLNCSGRFAESRLLTENGAIYWSK